jgi:cytochrome c
MRVTTILGCALLWMSASVTPVMAQDAGAALVSKAMCTACHQMDAASIGPTWRAIAARHAARKQLMTDALVSKVIHGGGGSWGLVPMVPNQRVNEKEARVMVEWILAQTTTQ